MAVDAVVFDLDETLAVTTRDRESLLSEAMAGTDLDPIDHDTYERAHRKAVTSEDRTPIFDLVIDDDRVDPATVARTYRRVVNDALEPIDGAEDLLGWLGNGAGYRVGVLTDGPVRAQESKLEVLGWDELLDATVVTGTIETRKPDPSAFRTVLAELSVAPERAAYVGDKPDVDVKGASEAGLHAIQVTYPGGPDVSPSADATIERARLREQLPVVLDSL